MVEVLFSDEFGVWWAGLDDGEQDAIAMAIKELEARGVTLGSPRSSQIKGTKYALRELRVQHRGAPYRIIYAFDPKRNAYLIIGGNKRGDGRFYERLIPIAERIWEQYLDEIA